VSPRDRSRTRQERATRAARAHAPLDRVPRGRRRIPLLALLLACSEATQVEDSPPEVSQVTVVGEPVAGEMLSGSYLFSDANGDLEGSSTFGWLRDGSPISLANGTSYVLASADVGSSISFEVTPAALTGASPGVAGRSPEVGPIAPAPAPVLADVSVTKSGPPAIAAGHAATYTLTATNAGPSVASTVVLLDVLPATVTLLDASDGGTVAGYVVTWPAVSLASAQ